MHSRSYDVGSKRSALRFSRFIPEESLCEENRISAIHKVGLTSFSVSNSFSFPILDVNCAFLAILFCAVSAVPSAMV